MNKAVGIGVIITVIVGILVISLASMNNSNDENIVSEEASLETVTEVEETGRDLSVEFTETLKMKSP